MAQFPFSKNRYLPKSYYDYEEPEPSWLSTHRLQVFIAAAIAILLAVSVVIYVIVSNNTPFSRLSRALGKDIDEGCDFHIETKINEENVMAFDGSAQVKNNRVSLIYDADYGDYTYQGVTLTHEGLSYTGVYYNDAWTVKNTTTEVLDFIDFYGDLRRGSFDAGAFLRFAGLTGKYSTVEFNTAFRRLVPRVEAQITDSPDGGAVFSYSPDVEALAEMLRENAASVFYRSTDYDAFSAKVEANSDYLKTAKCALVFRIDKDGYMGSADLTLRTEDSRYDFSVSFSDFGEPSREIPESFFDAAEILQSKQVEIGAEIITEPEEEATFEPYIPPERPQEE